MITFLVLVALIIGTFPFFSISGAESARIKNQTLNSPEDNATDENQENRIAIIDTSYGIIKFELFERRAPISAENFITLSLDHFYDGLLFHRIIDDFVIQTGDPNTRDNNPYNDGSGGSSNTIPLEIHPELTHIDGAVGMARGAEENSATSQFYICDGPQHGLDGDYAVFGVVFEGIDVVRKIAQVETWGNKRPALKDHPIEDVYMYSVFITENNSEYHHDPPGDESSGWPEWNNTPGFEGILVVIGVIIIIIAKNKRKR